MLKFISLLLFSLMLESFLYSQPSIQWQQSYGGTNVDVATSIQQTHDRGFIVAGYTNSNDSNVTGNHGNYDYWIVKLDTFGRIEWEKALGGSDEDKANSISQTNDHGYIIAGTSRSNDGDVTGSHGYFDWWIIKLDSSGTMQWQKTLGGTSADFANSIQQTSDLGYIVAGSSNSINGDVTVHYGFSDYWIVKLDNSGNIIWQKSIGGTGSEEASSIQQTSDGGFIVGGDSDSDDLNVTGNHGAHDYWVAKLDSIGNIQWEKSLGGSNIEFFQSIRQTFDKGFILCGTTYSSDGDVTGNFIGFPAAWSVKLDSLGTIQWQKRCGGDEYEGAWSIQQTSDSGYIFSGVSGYVLGGDVTINHGGPDCWIVKFNPNGSISWQTSLGGQYGEWGYSIQQTIGDGFIIAGTSNSNDQQVSGNNGDYDYWIVKLEFPGPVSINEMHTSISNIQIVPNPFSDVTTISFNSSSSKKYIIEIKDGAGRLVRTISTENISKESNTVLWDATDNNGSKVKEGIYFIGIVCENFCLSRKVLVLRN